MTKTKQNKTNNDGDDDKQTSRTITRRAETWDSGLEVLEPGDAQVLIPERLKRICMAIQREVNGNEFGILVKGEWTEHGFVLTEDYVVPEQRVTRTRINYKEDLKKYRDQGYNVSIHSHPFSQSKSTCFSGTDDDSVNVHFDCAVLFSGSDEFADATATVEVAPGVKVQLKPDPVVYEEEEELPEVDTENIQERTYNYSRNRNYTVTDLINRRSSRGSSKQEKDEKQGMTREEQWKYAQYVEAKRSRGDDREEGEEVGMPSWWDQ